MALLPIPTPMPAHMSKPTSKPTSKSTLPKPQAHDQALSQQLAYLIQQTIKNTGGYISFAQFMQMALYTPNLGYYSGGATKFGAAGDFITAPEMSPIFAKTIANQVAQVLVTTQGNVLELGAGSGKLATDLLLALQQLSALPKQYFVLEVSNHLRQIQFDYCLKNLPSELFKKIVWLETLPVSFVGLIVGNEVLDAVPAHIVQKTPQGWREQYIAWDEAKQTFFSLLKPLSVPTMCTHLPQNLPNDYITEVNPAANGLVNSLLACIKQGVLLLIDYGFNAAEYYHPQRNLGTLMCHYQHYAHSQPLINIGLQDITTHINFSAIAEAGVSQGHILAGFCSQAQFLINCGILDILQRLSAESLGYMQQTAAVQKLLSPAEMGDLFKVMAFIKQLDVPLIGFKSGDKSHTL